MKLSSITLVLALSTLSINAFAEGSVHHSGQASKHSVLAVGEGALSTAKVASAVVAVPVIATGSVMLSAGAASVHTGASLAEAVSRPHAHQALVITETTITADPAPNQVIVVQKKQTVINQH